MKTALIVLALIAVGCTGESSQPPAAEAETVTVTTTATPESVTSATGETSSIEEDIFGEDAATVSSGDARACELVRLAATREANSPSWIDIMSSAGSRARDFDLQDAIDKAYWTSSDALAAERTRAIVRYCDDVLNI